MLNTQLSLVLTLYIIIAFIFSSTSAIEQLLCQPGISCEIICFGTKCTNKEIIATENQTLTVHCLSSDACLNTIINGSDAYAVHVKYMQLGLLPNNITDSTDIKCPKDKPSIFCENHRQIICTAKHHCQNSNIISKKDQRLSIMCHSPHSCSNSTFDASQGSFLSVSAQDFFSAQNVHLFCPQIISDDEIASKDNEFECHLRCMKDNSCTNMEFDGSQSMPNVHMKIEGNGERALENAHINCGHTSECVIDCGHVYDTCRGAYVNCDHVSGQTIIRESPGDRSHMLIVSSEDNKSNLDNNVLQYKKSISDLQREYRFQKNLKDAAENQRSANAKKAVEVTRNRFRAPLWRNKLSFRNYRPFD